MSGQAGKRLTKWQVELSKCQIIERFDSFVSVSLVAEPQNNIPNAPGDIA
jgi:hypothetical protein